MNWFTMPAPVTGAIELDVGGAAALAVALAVFAACVPGWLAVRDVLRGRARAILRPRRRMRVVADLVAVRGGRW